jgi:hypothetical protein
MKKILATALIVIGILSVVYGGFTYTTQTNKATLGPINVSTNEKHTVFIPIGVGVATSIAGLALLIF